MRTENIYFPVENWFSNKNKVYLYLKQNTEFWATCLC